MDGEVVRARARALMAYIPQEIPGVRYAFKDDPPSTIPWKDRLAHAVARRMVRGYDTRFTTVIYPIVYFPAGAREDLERCPERWYSTLRHEFVHLKDYQRYGLLFGMSYVALLPMLWTLRAFWELRGYTQNMIVNVEHGGQIPDSQLEHMLNLFVGPDYFFMMWPRRRAQRRLLELREEVLAGRVRGVYPYGPLKVPLPPELREL